MRDDFVSQGTRPTQTMRLSKYFDRGDLYLFNISRHILIYFTRASTQKMFSEWSVFESNQQSAFFAAVDCNPAGNNTFCLWIFKTNSVAPTITGISVIIWNGHVVMWWKVHFIQLVYTHIAYHQGKTSNFTPLSICPFFTHTHISFHPLNFNAWYFHVITQIPVPSKFSVDVIK